MPQTTLNCRIARLQFHGLSKTLQLGRKPLDLSLSSDSEISQIQPGNLCLPTL